jgi:formate hydrogenlyase subunit 6/NADH:ubiquinone oxidoreductase subunit I
MNILTMMLKNLRGGSRTMLFPLRPRVTDHYRGLVRFDPALCSGCAICKMRCTSRAIEFKTGKGEFTWSYDPGQCTFCGRCVEGCKEHALSQDSACPPVYTTIGELRNSYTVARRPPEPKLAVTVPAAVAAQAPIPATGETK